MFYRICSFVPRKKGGGGRDRAHEKRKKRRLATLWQPLPGRLNGGKLSGDEREKGEEVHFDKDDRHCKGGGGGCVFERGKVDGQEVSVTHLFLTEKKRKKENSFSILQRGKEGEGRGKQFSKSNQTRLLSAAMGGGRGEKINR